MRVHNMDYPHWNETYRTRTLCTCRPLSTTGHVLDRMTRFSSLGIYLTLSRRINNGVNDQIEQQTKLTGFATAR
jgi:hypothetical protein